LNCIHRFAENKDSRLCANSHQVVRVEGLRLGLILLAFTSIGHITRRDMSQDFHLIIFTRHPIAGEAKTRMIPALGEAGAAALQREMTGHMLLTARCLPRPLHLRLKHAGGTAAEMRAWLGEDIEFSPQGDGDLGKRLSVALAESFAAGAQRVLVVGSDCPMIDAACLEQALVALDAADVSIVPALDGGYCLIGLKAEQPMLFEGIAWGSEQVFAQTMHAAKCAGLRVHELPALPDVDVPDDLAVVQRAGLMQGMSATASVSVIIPALNEEEAITATIRSVMDDAREIIVVDGGSNDDTVAKAESAGARVLRSVVACRAAQMNLGARNATGEVLVFLHADTRLPDGYAPLVRATLLKPGVVAGAFRLGVDGNGIALRLIEWGTWLRCRWFQMPYGDQGIFTTADAFRASGGFVQWPLMEEWEWIRRMRRLGKIDTLATPSLTSSRRWLALGPWRTMLRNQSILLAKLAGVPIERLAAWYRQQ
jgi:hypothetical protein